ncbi:MAG: UvrD-helicase domain-containing protein, partial [Bacteroidales bacterium]|nr:UvrD-helicase domain-containing protein [Bacteroidales bacterium]
MQKNFTVYKSSAGSGKTYTLVKEYLKIVLNSPEKFRNVLAITFTNKAANEMKERIIGSLKEIAANDVYPDTIAVQFMLPEIIKETGIAKSRIAENARKVLSSILHKYSDFAVSTIDSFVHRIIRSFAFDLHLPLNFEVELDMDELIAKVIDILISKVGTDEKLTTTLLNFTQAKTDQEKSWNIELDLTEIARLLLKEEGQIHIEKLKKLDLSDFSEINKQVSKSVNEFEGVISKLGREAIDLINSRGIPHQAFYQGRSGISKYFEYLANGRFDKINPNSYVQTTLGEDKWVSGKAGAEDISSIDEIKDDLIRYFQKIDEYSERHYERYVVLNEVRKNLYPVAVLNEIEKVMDEYKSENDVLLISEFNKRIAEIVLSEPVPFIYERVGEKYQHFLLDEFQDTSILQWQNLLPLIDNSLGGSNFNMIVGDGKQAIYRWRGGEVEQFATLPKIYKRPNDQIQEQREQSLIRNYKEEVLEYNFRSKKEIIDFNNDFFGEISNRLPDEYRLIYQDVNQKSNEKNTGGHVHIEFYDKDKSDLSLDEFNLLRIKETIRQLTDEDGFGLKDIAILCRNNKNASLIAADLLENKINVISSESLLLVNSPTIRFLIAVIKSLLNYKDKIAQTEVISYLSKTQRLKGKLQDNLSGFGIVDFKKGDKNPGINFFEKLAVHDFTLNKYTLLNLTLYDLCEELIRIFKLNKIADPYLQFFLDAVIKLTSEQNQEVNEFLDWWEENKGKISIIVPEGINAVQVMTIHKAKGLEFPVVIYPFATERHRRTKDKLWVDFEDKEIPKLKVALVNTSKSLLETQYEAAYLEEDSKSILDLINLLYVVFTRPVNRLYVFTSQPPQKSDAAESVP